jgi:TonB family protein
VDRGGRVQTAKISRRSGNRYFDSSIEEMLTNTRRLPPPPAAIADALVRSGFEIEFAGKDQ